MEEKNITEIESLQLITRMIQQTKDRLNIGSGNTFLIWGYVDAIISLLVGTLCLLLQNGYFSLLYLLIPVIGIPISMHNDKQNSKREGTASNYTSQLLANLWNVIGWCFAIAAIIIVCFYFIYHANILGIFWMLGFILPALGCAVTGLIIKEKILTYGGYFGIACGIWFIGAFIVNPYYINLIWTFIFALCYIVMMVIPGHYLNYKAKKQNA